MIIFIEINYELSQSSKYDYHWNESNMNYGIYANGLLVESCSKRYLNECSYLQIQE
jgi:hypothetical protein